MNENKCVKCSKMSITEFEEALKEQINKIDEIIERSFELIKISMVLSKSLKDGERDEELGYSSAKVQCFTDFSKVIKEELEEIEPEKVCECKRQGLINFNEGTLLSVLELENQAMTVVCDMLKGNF